jgi:cell division protein FtsB
MARAATIRARPRASGGRPVRARQGGIRWDRVGRVALLAVLVAVLALYISPARQWFQQRGTAAAHTDQLRELEAEHDRLEQRARTLRNPDSLEREARKLGMVRRGERSFVIENAPR